MFSIASMAVLDELLLLNISDLLETEKKCHRGLLAGNYVVV